MKIVVKNEDGRYLSIGCGLIELSADRKRAQVFDTDNSSLDTLLDQLAKSSGMTWTREPLVPHPADVPSALSDKERIARHKRFMEKNWQQIGAFAWQSYQDKGRGAVIVQERDILTMDTPRKTATPFDYAAERRELMTVLRKNDRAKEDRWIREYDPDTTVIFLVVAKKRVSSYFFSGTPKPSQCLAVAKPKPRRVKVNAHLAPLKLYSRTPIHDSPEIDE